MKATRGRQTRSTMNMRKVHTQAFMKTYVQTLKQVINLMLKSTLCLILYSYICCLPKGGKYTQQKKELAEASKCYVPHASNKLRKMIDKWIDISML